MQNGMRMDFAEAFTQRRRTLNLTQTQAAALLGIDKQTVSRWEGGTRAPQRRLWPEIAMILGSSVDEVERLVVARGQADNDAAAERRTLAEQVLQRSLEGVELPEGLVAGAAKMLGVSDPSGESRPGDEFDAMFGSVVGQPVLEPRQADLVDALIARIKSGSPMSAEDASAVTFLTELLRLPEGAS